MICPKCSLPKELCVCGTIEKEGVERIKVYVTKAKFGKLVTIVEGITKNVEKVAKELKKKMACGGTAKGGTIILQGNHKVKIKDTLIGLGYPEENITVL